jgi:hypothetical protein
MDAMLWILTMALVALAGALWAAGIVEAYSSRRRRGEPSELPAPEHSRQITPSSSRLHLALRFWRGWTQARDERWRATDAEPAVAMADWPRYARTIASDLALDRDTMIPAIVSRFADVMPPADHR